MAEDRRISLCFTNYNRTEMLYEAFEKVYHDERISEIVVSDDHSTKDVYYELEKLFYHFPKVKMFRNDVNIDCYRNKKNAVDLATNNWVCVLDSDNKFGKDYIDTLFEFDHWNDNTIYAPTFAKPTFDYRIFQTELISKENIMSFIGRKFWDTALNTMNFFVNKNEFLKVWDGSVDPITADSIYFNYCWLNAGNKIYFVPNLEYEHRVHPHSHYTLNNHRTNGFYEKVLRNIEKMA